MSQTKFHIPFEKYQLENGLQVILHRDRKLPVVHLNLWYHVGSKNERPNRTGFAHLFEHMMFQGSKNADGPYITFIEKAGANLREGGVNGTTSFDRTNYFETVPREGLEYVLWLESDRMGFLADALTQEKFDNQRDVVKNERRQSYENVPYGRAFQMVFEGLFPKGHPYSWLVIGSQEDLDAASLEDVKEFFHTFYTPNNCSLVVAGDFEEEEAKRLVARYFGPLSPGPALERPRNWVPSLEGEKRIEVRDRVPQERIYLAWATPAYFQPGDAELDLASRILSQGKNSRLYKTLVYDRQIASDVSAFNYSLEICGMFGVVATARPGENLDKLKEVMMEEINQFAEEGPTEDELLREKAKQEYEFISGLERLGGFGGKADALNQYNTYLGTPDFFGEDYARYQSLTAHGIQRTVEKYLNTPNRLAVTFIPEASQRPVSVEIDRSIAPNMGEKGDFQAPGFTTHRLSNGLTVIVSERDELPKVAVGLVVKAGSTADQATLPGEAWMTAEMLDEGTGSRSALDIQAALDRLGVILGTAGESEISHVGIDTLERNLVPAMELMADIVLNPSFPDSELERQRKQRLDSILQERNSPPAIARKSFRSALFGSLHPFGRDVAGNESSIEGISRDDLLKYYQQYWKPNHSALIFAGAISMTRAIELSEKYFGGWPAVEVPAVQVPVVHPPKKMHLYLVDRQDAPQSQIRLGSIGPKRNTQDHHAIELLNTVMGGAFSSRLNLNLREEKGYTYGASTTFAFGRDTGFWVASTGVQTRFTAETLIELVKEFREIVNGRPVTAHELEMAKTNLIRGFSQRFETLGRVVDQAVESISFDLDLAEIQRYPEEIEAITLEDVNAAARRYYNIDQSLAVIVGDLTQIEQKIRELNLGEVVVLDSLGNPVK
ncbi:MAG: pitrilysin family protein [Terriglobia bacterium]